MFKAQPVSNSNPSGAIIGYKNLISSSTTTDALKSLTPNTWERWRPSGTFTVKFQLAQSSEVDFIAIGAHALKDETILLQTAETVGGALTDAESFSPKSNQPLMANFKSRTIQEIAISGTLSAANEIGVVYAGKSMQMPSSIYGGHSPAALSNINEYRSNNSGGGQLLSRDIKRRGQRTNFEWSNLDPNWYREVFKEFLDSAESAPFFIKWRPVEFPNEVSLLLIDGNISPSNDGGGSKNMSVSIPVSGHSDL